MTLYASQYTYPAAVTPEVGGWVYEFLDFNDTLARGQTHEEATANAEAVLRTVLATYPDPLPTPSEPPWNGAMISVTVERASAQMADDTPSVALDDVVMPDEPDQTSDTEPDAVDAGGGDFGGGGADASWSDDSSGSSDSGSSGDGSSGADS